MDGASRAGITTLGIRFTLESRTVEVEGRPHEVVCAVMGDECDVAAEQMLATRTMSGARSRWRRVLIVGGGAMRSGSSERGSSNISMP